MRRELWEKVHEYTSNGHAARDRKPGAARGGAQEDHIPPEDVHGGKDESHEGGQERELRLEAPMP